MVKLTLFYNLFDLFRFTLRPGSNKSRLMPRGLDYEYCFSNPAAGTPFESQPRFW
jgi:hypothetical protein